MEIEECFITVPSHDDFLLREASRKSKYRKYSHFHPSSFSDCFRKIAFQYYGELDEKFIPPTTVDTRLERIFSAGHAFHWRMQGDLARAGILRGYWKCKRCKKVHGTDNKIGILLPDKCDCGDDRHGLSLFDYKEIEVKNKEYNFKGNTDGVIELSNNDISTNYVIDFKTIKTERFNLLRKPDFKYLTQINIYMWLLGLKSGIIYYEDKNDQSVKEFLVHYNEKLIDSVKENSKKLLYVLKNHKLPSIPANFSKHKMPCRYCDYSNFLCWKD